ncbi:glutathione peroxidase [Loigolactobacillus coryniformis subsp. coryniformis]|uniref:Glutathione peroxidase n=2 Tax=Loigolactobacillus coryniformis TaxID=1610 RepID=A0A2D1KRA3_9LACO|nr:glutathione peroxidase [Loigolactobacillus coryniformis]ATO44572.1 glutathione peroxidase [Loigolactobacillus coryniformis subsp. torquens DSM 20004 = KCTC 3535]KRK66342.1 Peroxiredoxin [Loigolactobacillus coryniformis subsp. torquens DSM 20004 = KCTC 3535]MBW4803312.1 glutathione peroxidase [Loigolactobacillus coryniformis subsp. torquens]MBW4806284.1 glutathione peroxidase [Loigolactobacillus coryniformis subsp. torquens]
MTSIYDFSITSMEGETFNLARYRGKVLLIVNTASKCGLAPQLKELEALHQKYQQQGLVVIGLPSNQFRQELASDEAASEYCQVHYGVTFLMTKRVAVNGTTTDPLFTYLKEESGHGRIKWNYTKFLIGRDGQVIHRYAPTTTPESFTDEIVAALATQAIPEV